MAANPCPCGQYGARDSRVHLPAAGAAALRGAAVGSAAGPHRHPAAACSASRRRSCASRARRHDDAGHARARVVAARGDAAAERLAGTPWRLNSHVPGSWLRGPEARLAPAVTASIDRALERGGITMRGYDRVLRLAWTVADLDGAARPDCRARRPGPVPEEGDLDMTMFGLNEAEVAMLVRAVTRDDLDTEAVERTLRAGDVDRHGRARRSARRRPRSRRSGPRARSPPCVERRTPSDARGLDAGIASRRRLAPALARWAATARPPPTRCSRCGRPRGSGCGCARPTDASWPAPFDDLGRARADRAVDPRRAMPRSLRSSDSIALVGARAATGYGEHVTMEASAGLVDRGFAIVSGAAYGIDGMAHRAALASHGTTVAFLAGGVDRFYPSGHDALLTRIVESGCGRLRAAVRLAADEVAVPAAQPAHRRRESGDRRARGGLALRLAQHRAPRGRPRAAARRGARPGDERRRRRDATGCIRESEAICVTSADEMAELAPTGLDSGRGSRDRRGHPDPTTTRCWMRSPRGRAAQRRRDSRARSGLSISVVRHPPLGPARASTGLACARPSGMAAPSARA